MRPVNRKYHLRMKGFLAIYFHRPQRPVAIRRQQLSLHPRPSRTGPCRHSSRRAGPCPLIPAGRYVMDGPARPLDHHLQLRRRERHGLLIRADFKRCRRPILFHHHPIRRALWRSGSGRRIGHVQHIVGFYFQPQHAILLPHREPVRLLLKAHHRIRRVPLPHRSRRHQPRYTQPNANPQDSKPLHRRNPFLIALATRTSLRSNPHRSVRATQQFESMSDGEQHPKKRRL